MDYDEEHYDPPAPALTVTIFNPYLRLHEELRALLDSGAALTVLPMRSVRKLSLVPVQVIKARGYDGRVKSVATYLVNFSISKFTFEMVEVLGAERGDVLLGRNILNDMTALLEGKALTFDLSDPR